MSTEEYWKGSPYLPIAYREAAVRRAEEKNQYLWLQGRYIYEAFDAVIHNRFSKKGTKIQDYPKEPYRITPLSGQEIHERKEAERQKAINSLNAWKAAWDMQHE